MPTFEYRNKTWSYHEVLEAVKRDAIRAVLANSGNLVREKLFQKSSRKVRDAVANATPTAEEPSDALVLHHPTGFDKRNRLTPARENDEDSASVKERRRRWLGRR
ncbi:hypothetical protein HK405_003577 [Cladochytrium tenue]|nr:hypothetical protein HK405_003577 [Cladochytrium tenue]